MFHYCVYKIHYGFHLAFNRINPANLIDKLPFQKKRYEKLGIDINKLSNDTFGNVKFGLSIMIAGGLLIASLFFCFSALFKFLLRTVGIYLSSFVILYVVSLLFSIIISNFLVFRKDKYIGYFDKFDKWNRRKKITYAAISVLFIIFSFYIMIISI